MTSAKHSSTYPPEFRAEAIRLARTSEKPYTQIARDLGMTTETLRKWREASRSGQGHTPGWTDHTGARGAAAADHR
jgi:transposase